MLENMDDIRQLQLRIAALERRQRVFRLVGSLGLIVALVASWGLSNVFAQPRTQSILRVRGLIIEDENGKARILLGAPIPAVADRKRRDTAIGMVVLDQSGLDRLQVGTPLPGPQMRGIVSERISPTTGLVFNGTDGNERGGLGVQDEGTAAFGLDFPNGREGVHLAVSPRLGFAGLLIHAEDGSREERATLGVTKDGKTSLKLSDPSGQDRMTIAAPDHESIPPSREGFREAYSP
jgi:hypothetical protein